MTHFYGLDAISSFAHLPSLKNTTLVGGQSSFDRTGANVDFSNFLYDDVHGDHVLLDVTGPGTVYRFWCVFDPSRLLATLKVYFDGELFPRITCLYRDLFAGHNAPFLAPLVGTAQASSGGYYCYLPLPFRHAIKITSNVEITSDPTSHFYYNIGYHLYPADAPVTSWTGSEDSAAARNLWCQSFIGREPVRHAGAKSVSGSLDLASGATQTILDVEGPGVISAVKLRIPEVAVPPIDPPAASATGSVTDRGRAHKGTSRFRMAVAVTNQGALLRRRLDYGVGDQCAKVYVDGALVGSWRTAGRDTTNRWRDSTFYIPGSFTAGKMWVAVKLRFVSSEIDWNEFRYTMISITGDGNIETDVLDVGDPTSEKAHDYAITRQTSVGSRTFTYPMPSATTTALLNDTWLRIFWDRETVSSVSAPLGSLFGMGRFGSARVRALPMGIDDNDWLYLYFPMPFKSHARIDLHSQSAGGVVTGDYQIERHPFTGSFSDVGYFHAEFHTQQPTTYGQDILILDAQGAGHLVGVVQSMDGHLGNLEGDERVYVDDSNTPVIQGTGTEDFYNGADYFDRGTFTRPVHGNAYQNVAVNSAVDRSQYAAQITAYRLLLHDAIPFRRHLQVSIEHGGTDTDTGAANENVWTLAFYYAQSARAVTTDTLNVGNLASEQAHGYKITAPTWNGTQTFKFEGVENTVAIADDGRAHKGASTFTMKVAPTNTGVLLRRRFDQGIGRQRARVFVDGHFVGDCYFAGTNSTFRWREEDFLIPEAHTRGKSAITVELKFVSSDLDWNEFAYLVSSVS